VLALGCYFGAVLNKEPGKTNMSPFRRQMQWGTPVVVLGCYVGVVLDKELGQIDVTS
jgi:hypothetical protein